MDLKDFVSQVLVQIVAGVGEANATMQEQGHYQDTEGFQLGRAASEKKNKPVEFDVAVMAKPQRGKTGQAGLQVAYLTASGKAGDASMNERVSRVRFEVSIPKKPKH